MTEDKDNELEVEKIIEDFLKEADQLEESDLNFYEQFLGKINKSFNNSNIEVSDEMACFYFLNSIALLFIYQKHGIEIQNNLSALLPKFKPYLNLAGTKENINSLLGLNPFEFREVSREFNSLCTKMFKKQSWVYKNYINLYLFDHCLGTSIFLNIIRIDGFTKNTGISPDKYFKFAIEPVKVSNFLYSSLLSESSNVPMIKDHFSKVANQKLKEIKELCEAKTRGLYHPEDVNTYKTEDVNTYKKFFEDKSANKTEAEGLFNEIVSEKFSGLKNLNDILKYGFTPGKQLLSLSTKFRKQLLNKIESYYSEKGITVKRQRAIINKMKNISEFEPEEQKKITKEYLDIFFKNEISIAPTDKLSDDFVNEQVISDADVEYILSDPETMLELFYSSNDDESYYSSQEYDGKEILSKFTLNQSPALKKVGLFLLDDVDNYINSNNRKFEITKIQEDSNTLLSTKLPKRNIERFVSEFYKFVKQNYPKFKRF